MIIAISNSEKADAFEQIFQAWSDSLLQCCGVQDARDRVAAVHSDLHKGIRSAVTTSFPRCVKHLDWAHFVGATARTKPTKTEAGSAAAVVKTMHCFLFVILIVTNPCLDAFAFWTSAWTHVVLDAGDCSHVALF